MDRASDYGSEGCRFESYRGHKENQAVTAIKRVTAFFFDTRINTQMENLSHFWDHR